MAFLISFFEYLVTFIILAAVALCGIFVGKKLRDRKDAKAELETTDAKIKE